jgi:hypothetical protein
MIIIESKRKKPATILKKYVAFAYAKTVFESFHSEMKRKVSFSFAFLSFFCNFAIKMAKLLRLGKKKNKFFCFALDFS